MATTSNLITSSINGSQDEFDFTFPYLNQSDIKVKLTKADDSASITLDNSKFTMPHATRIKLSATDDSDYQATSGAPKAGIKGLIYRDTDSSKLAASFYPGSAIKSGDLNDNFTQNLYVTQEAEVDVNDAVTDAATALTTATTANATANTAKTTADTANDNSLKQDGVTPPGGANAAITIAQAAETTANAASAAVSTVLPYTIKANAAAVQALFGGSDSPTADDIFELTATDDLPVKILSAAWASGTTYKLNDQRTNDSGKLYLCIQAGTSAGSGGPTGEGSSITDNGAKWKYIAATNGIWTISGGPAQYPTFSTGITVKLKYASGDASASTWTWQSYHANDPETRYAPTDAPALTGTATAVNLDISGNVDIDGTLDIDGLTSDAAIAVNAGPSTFKGDIDFKNNSSNITGIKFYNNNDTKNVSLKAHESASADQDIYFPAAGIGASGKVLEGTLTGTKTYLNWAVPVKKDAYHAWTKPQGTSNTTGTHSSGNLVLDLDASQAFEYELQNSSSIEVQYSGTATVGQTWTLFLKQDSTGSRLCTWVSTIHWKGGTAGTLSTAASAVDRIDLMLGPNSKMHAVITNDIKASS